MRENRRALGMLLTVKEVADLLRCSVATVWNWSAQGLIPRPVKIGGATRWRKSDLTRKVEGLKPVR